ncbi:BolA/IbaG family iron-sulfur metabolism protein [bacterium]|jgi:stress-induced morphogen|nr:BolA/IbaG family iron-sulfur metabolism protein [bacterium]MBT6293809.1 BolA/IbaG family iron-sulfur metabolism protein [bacterium]
MTQIVNQEYIVNKLQESLDKDAVVEIKSRDKAFKHLEFYITSSILKQMPLIKAHRSVLNIFKDELDQNLIHAISITIKK